SGRSLMGYTSGSLSLSFHRSSAPSSPHTYPTRRSSGLAVQPCRGCLLSTRRTPRRTPPRPAHPPRPHPRHAHQRRRTLRHRQQRSEEHTSELQSRENLVCRLLLEKKTTHYPSNPPSTRY